MVLVHVVDDTFHVPCFDVTASEHRRWRIDSLWKQLAQPRPESQGLSFISFRNSESSTCIKHKRQRDCPYASIRVLCDSFGVDLWQVRLFVWCLFAGGCWTGSLEKSRYKKHRAPCMRSGGSSIHRLSNPEDKFRCQSLGLVSTEKTQEKRPLLQICLQPLTWAISLARGNLKVSHTSTCPSAVQFFPRGCSMKKRRLRRCRSSIRGYHAPASGANSTMDRKWKPCFTMSLCHVKVQLSHVDIVSVISGPSNSCFHTVVAWPTQLGSEVAAVEGHYSRPEFSSNPSCCSQPTSI
jgi:hypothetical protein